MGIPEATVHRPRLTAWPQWARSALALWVCALVSLDANRTEGKAPKQAVTVSSTNLKPLVDRLRHATTDANPTARPLLKVLTLQLHQLQGQYSTGTVQRMSQVLDVLAQQEFEPQLIEDVRARFLQANLYGFIDASLVARHCSVRQQREISIDEMILGTHVEGTGWTKTSVDGKLLPVDDGVRVRLIAQANTRSRTIGFQGAARVFSVGQTFVEAEKDVLLKRDGWHSFPTKTTGQTNSSIVDFQWHRPIGETLALATARKQKKATDAESNRLAQRRVQQELDRQVAKQVGRFYQIVMKPSSRWLSEQAMSPTRLQFRSTRQGIEGAVTIANPRQLSTASVYPGQKRPADLYFEIHESLINNLLEQRFGGRALGEDRWATELGSHQFSDALALQDADRKWTIHFQRLRPLVVRFADKGITIGLRARRFQLGDRTYPAARIAARYRLDRSQPKHFKWVRRPRLDVDVIDGKDRSVGVRQQVFRSLLRQRFEKVFPATWQLDQRLLEIRNGSPQPLPLPNLSLEFVEVHPEWLAVGLSAGSKDGVK